MQIIQKIREKGAAIVIAIIALSLIGFILMDAKPGGKFFSGGRSTEIGKINGKSIEGADFNKKVKLAEAQDAQQNGQQPNAARSAQIREQVWNQVVAEEVFFTEAAKLDIDITAAEVTSILMSNDPGNPLLYQQGMIDPATQKIDQAKVQQALRNIKKLKGEEKENVNAQLIDPLRVSNTSTKYMALLNASAYYPSWMQQKDSVENQSYAVFSYAAIPYNVISDSAIKVADADIEKYIKEHKLLFKQEAGRMLSYISFSALPSASDSAKVLETISTLKNSFGADTNSKAFVARNSANPDFVDEYLPKNRIQSSAIDTITKQPAGVVVGPYVDNGSYVLAKVLGTKTLPDSVKARHILIATNNPQTGEPIMEDSVAKKLADSIFTAVKGGADFAALAAKYSADGSKDKGGDLGTFGYGQMVPEFNDFCFNKPVGEKGVVRTQFGYHVIDVLNQSNFNPAYKIAFVSKEILASDATINEANVKANKLYTENKTNKGLEAYLQKNGIQKTSVPALVKENDFMLGGLQDARPIVKWAFEAKQGDVSEPFSVGDQFVVAVVEKLYKEGTQDVATARPAVEPIIRNQKKAEEIIKKIGANPTLESAAAAYGKQVMTAGADSSVTFAGRMIKEMGPEPKVIGAAFNKENQTKVSTPIIGNAGVYLIKVTSMGNKADEVALVQMRNNKMSYLRNQALSDWLEALRKQATIKDKRFDAM